MKFSLIILIVLLANCSRAVGQFSPSSDSENKAGWVLNQSVSDEFDGEVEKRK